MPFSFPSSPTVGQTSTQNGRSYRYAGNNVWELAVSGGGSGEDTLLRSLFVPPAPTNLTATAGNAQVSLSWTAPTVLAQTPINGYTVEYTPSGGSPSTVTTGSTSTSYVITGLANGTAYSVRVAGVNGAGDGAYASPVTATPRTVPGAPTSLVATAGDAQLSLSWTAPASNGGAAITGYTVEFTPSGGSASTVNTGSTSTSYALTALTNGTAYSVRVAAANAAGTGSYSSSASGTPASSSTVPGAPTNVVAELYGEGAALNWTDPASNGGSAITGYVVQFSTNGGNTWTTTTLDPLAGYRGQYQFVGPPVDHVFRVAATNSVGTGNYSSPSNPVGGA